MYGIRGCVALIFWASLLLASCATPTGSLSPMPGAIPSYTGRISLVIHSEAAQSLSGSYELRGDLLHGELALSTPLGQTALQLHWGYGYARLSTPQGARDYPSVAALVEASTGIAIPVETLFAWLRGEQAQLSGWQVDLTRQSEGRIHVQRRESIPAIDLRIMLEPRISHTNK